jgi:hypothetical protein
MSPARASAAFVAALLGVSMVTAVAFSGPAAGAVRERPAITKVSPGNGSGGGGQPVEIRGRRFFHVKEVRFGSTPARSYFMSSATRLFAVAPSRQSSDHIVNIRVITRAGSTPVTHADRFTFVKPAPLELKTVALPDPSISIDDLECVQRWCAATANAGSRSIFEVRSGDKWSSLRVPVAVSAKDATSPHPAHLSCPTSGWCAAIGSDDSGHAIVTTLSGGALHTVRIPEPDGLAEPFYSHVDISCSAVNTCAAVLNGRDAGSPSSIFVDVLNGSGWHLENVPEPTTTPDGQPSDGLSTVSCSTGLCVALSGTDITAADWVPQVAWTIGASGVHESKLATPSGGSEPFVYGVDCYASGACVAAGHYRAADGRQSPLMERYSGGAWTAFGMPRPSAAFKNQQLSLRHVSCTRTGACVATGENAIAEGDPTYNYPTPFVSRLNGTTATTAELPVPSSSRSPSTTHLWDVSCYSAARCDVIGTAATGFLDTYSRGVWTTHPISGPRHLACGAPAFCVAPVATINGGKKRSLIETEPG